MRIRDIENRGVLSGITNGSKSAYFEPVPFNWEEHLQGKKVQGLSPIRKDRAKWLCVDIDLKIDPMEFCGKIFMKLGPQYFPFKTMSGRWRVVEFLDDWENLESVAKRSKDLENIIFKKCKYKCDSGHTLPYNKGWVFLPYHSADTTCYSPGGNPLTKEQFEFRCRYKNIALIASAVGMKPGGRAKALIKTFLNLWMIYIFTNSKTMFLNQLIKQNTINNIYIMAFQSGVKICVELGLIWKIVLQKKLLHQN